MESQGNSVAKISFECLFQKSLEELNKLAKNQII